jgi:pilus assembly protein FimV
MLACLPLKNHKGAFVRNSKNIWLVALLVALLPCVAGAAGLGRLNVLSALGQPFNAEIELVSVTKEELGSLSARLGQPDAYRSANLQYNTALTGARATVERRPNGQAYVKIISTRPVTEPFIDVLIELTWAAGRLSREYTALLDPPGTAPAPAPVIAATPESRPAPAPAPAPTPKAKPDRAPSAPVTPAAPMAGGKEYGPIQRGDTLGKIAKEVMPEGVTLEQMLVALYRTNTDAFINKNLNLVRTGKILRVPDREEVAAITKGEAVKVYRTHVADWNSYRQKVADSAGKTPAEGRTAVSGKITTKVEEKGPGGAAKDVVRLSKGEAPSAAAKGKPRSSAERIRALEEEAVARERALKDANERVTQLEKTIKDMQKLAELKSPGMAAAQQQAQQATAPKPDAKAPAKPEAKKPEAVAVAKPEPAKPEAKKPDAVAAAKPEAAKPEAAKPEPAKPEAAKPEAPKPDTAKPDAGKSDAPPAQVAVPDAKKDAPAAKPAPKKPAAPPPPPEPDLVDQILEAATDPVYLGIGGGILALGIVAFVMARRRRSRRGDDDTHIPPKLDKAAAAAAGAAAVTTETTAAQEPGAAAAAADDVDPLAEAEVYIAYGRDGQAEEILKEALAKNPKREDVQLKLLEIYAARKDKSAFAKVAGDLHKQTGGSGDTWLKAAAMGYALDSANSLYAAGKDAAPAARAPAATADVDLDLGLGDAGTTTDITLDAGAAGAAAGTDTAILDLGADEKAGGQPAASPDFTLEVPAAEGTQTDVALEATATAQDTNMLDFKIELPAAAEEPATKAVAPAAAGTDGGLDFKLDDLTIGDSKTGAGPLGGGGGGGGEKDGHWYDVQTKFDLAKAYQEMGDKDGAKEILQEVIKEGDTEQKAQAKSLMDSLG